MKSFHLTVWGLLLIFSAIMLLVVSVTFNRKSNSCKLDPSHIKNLREMAQK